MQFYTMSDAGGRQGVGKLHGMSDWYTGHIVELNPSHIVCHCVYGARTRRSRANIESAGGTGNAARVRELCDDSRRAWSGNDSK
jgi:hypothetical protein